MGRCVEKNRKQKCRGISSHGSGSPSRLFVPVSFLSSLSDAPDMAVADRSIASFVRKLGVEAGIVGKYYCKRNLNTDFFHYLLVLFYINHRPLVAVPTWPLADSLTHYPAVFPSPASFALTLMEFLSSFFSAASFGQQNGWREEAERAKHLLLKVLSSKVFLRANAIGIN